MLPKEYQEVEYLESTEEGGQYLDSGYYPNIVTWATCTYEPVVKYTDSSMLSLFGYGTAGTFGGSGLCFRMEAGARLYSRMFVVGNGSHWGNPTASSSIFYTAGRKVRVSIRKNELKFECFDNPSLNREYQQQRNAAELTGRTALVFALNSSNGATEECRSMRIYSLTFYEDDEQKVNLVPCYRKADEKPGMYDTVRKIFLTNQGTGEFICGPAVYNALLRETNGLELARRRMMLLSKVSNSLLPYEYQEVEYLEADGNQYIDTGIVPENGFGFFIDFMPLTNVDRTSASSKLMGSSKRNNGFWGGIVLSTYAATNGGQMTWFAKNKWYDPGFESYTRIQMSNINNHYYSSTGKDYQTPYITASDIYGTLYLLTINNDQGVISGAGSRLWLCKLYNNDDVVANLVPCYRKADEKLGMYDMVRKIFLTNQGTGEFDTGPEIHGADDIHPGTLKYWWSGKNAPYNNRWSERLSHGTHVMFLYNKYVYDYDNQYYEFSYNGGYGSRPLNDMQFDIGNHWRFVFDIELDHAETNSTFVDIGSVAAANHSIGFGIFPGQISVNWKLNGNNSNPGISNLSHPGVPADNGYNRMRGYFEINDGGDGYDRLSVMVNKKLVTYDVKIPQVHYGPSWDRNLLLFGRGHTNGYYAKCRIYDLRFYVID